MNIIGWLNKSTNGNDVFFYGIVFILVFSVIWNFFIKKILYKYHKNEFASFLLEIGPLGFIGIVFTLALILLLILQAILLCFEYPKAIPTVFVFLGLIALFFSFIIRKIK